MTTSPKQVSLFVVKWKPKAGQPIPWEIKQKLCKPKGGRNKKGDFDNFHNRDYDFVSPSGEIFTGKGVRQFAQEHGLYENCLYNLLDGRLHSYKGWTKAVGGRKLPVPPTYYFLSPSGEIYTTTNLSEFARQRSLDPIALSRLSRCIIGIHRGWRHCTPDGQPITPPDRKHRKFILRSPTGEIVEGSNLKAFAEQHGLSRTCLMNILSGTTKEHRGWTLPATEVVGKPDNFQEKLPATAKVSTTTTAEDNERTQQFKIGDACGGKLRVEFLCDVAFGDIDTKAKNPNAKLALTGECAEVCGVRGTRLAVSIGGDPFDWPIRLVKKISDATLDDSLTPKNLEVGDRLLSNHPITKGEIVVAEYPTLSSDGKKEVKNWDFVLTTENKLIHTKYLSEIKGADSSRAIAKWEKVECTSPVDIFSVGHLATQKVRRQQDTSPSGQSKTTPTPQPSTESDSPAPDSSNKILPPLTTNLSVASVVSISSLVGVRARISVLLENAPGLKELADSCFLNTSDSLKSSSLQLFVGSKFQQSYQVEMDLTTSKSLMRLQRWGMWGLGKCEMATDTNPKTENDYSAWVFTGDIRATTPKLGKKTLAEIIGDGNAIVYRAASGDRIYHEQSPCLRSLNNAGSGAYKIREYNGETYFERPINATEAEQLMGWEVGSTATGINSEGDEISISQTQRIKMLGNGIIPAEITDILTAIKPMLERKLESEIPQGSDFAYRQLRQKNYSHQESVSLLADPR